MFNTNIKLPIGLWLVLFRFLVSLTCRDSASSTRRARDMVMSMETGKRDICKGRPFILLPDRFFERSGF